MNFSRLIFLYLIITVSALIEVAAETAYLTDRFQAGLHEDKSYDSPIIKTVTAGTSMEIIKREKNFTYVRDQDGVTGWIDNSYLVDKAPAGIQLGKLILEKETIEKQLADATRQISRMQGNNADSGDVNITELTQQLNTERLRAGELQIQLAEMKKRIGQDNDKESLYNQIEQLQETNKTLEIQLAGVVNNDGTGYVLQNEGNRHTGFLIQGWKRELLYFFLAIIFGVVLGIYGLDFYNRRRHGGFRV